GLGLPLPSFSRLPPGVVPRPHGADLSVIDPMLRPSRLQERSGQACRLLADREEVFPPWRNARCGREPMLVLYGEGGANGSTGQAFIARDQRPAGTGGGGAH